MAEATFFFWMWLLFGQFYGYDWRNCEMVPFGDPVYGVYDAVCYGPPLSPGVEAIEAEEPARERVSRTTPRTRSGRTR